MLCSLSSGARSSLNSRREAVYRCGRFSPHGRELCRSFRAGHSFHYFLVGIVCPHFLQTRTFTSPSVFDPTRAGPQLGQINATFETSMGDSCSAMPPLVRCPCLLETVFLTTRTCSTNTVPLSGKTRSTRPVLPRSEPLRTLTVSLR